MTQRIAEPQVAEEPVAAGSSAPAAPERNLRRRRRLGLLLVLLGGVIVLGFAWLAITGLMARGELQRVRADMTALRTQVLDGDLSGARTTARRISGHADRAHALTTGPVWALGAGLPGGEPLRTVRALTKEVDRIGTTALPELVTASTGLEPSRLRRADGSIDLGAISGARPALARALAQVGAARREVASTPSRTWVGEVDAARADLLRQLTSVRATLTSADLAARIIPPMLGQHGVRRYFVAFQNEAEARGTGGIPGAFAILRAENGRIAFERFEPDSFLYVTPVDVRLGADYDALFRGTQSTSLYVNTNLSPHYPYAAQTWLAMWRQRTGEQLDGAIAVDPTVLAALLRATGPARMADGTSVTADNVVRLTQSTVYAKFAKPSQNDARKAYLLDIARAVSAKVLASKADTTGLVKAAAGAAGQRRILVYSTDPAVEGQLARTSLSGDIPVTNAPYAGMSIVNDGGNKLDYYLDRSLTWRADGCGSPRAVTVTMRLRNNAPASGLSPYVTSRTDDHTYPVRPGDNREEITYYATSGAVMQSLTVDGRRVSAEAGRDRGHPVFRFEVEVPRGRTVTVVLRLAEPAGGGSAPIVLKQPLIRPLALQVEAPRCK